MKPWPHDRMRGLWLMLTDSPRSLIRIWVPFHSYMISVTVAFTSRCCGLVIIMYVIEFSKVFIWFTCKSVASARTVTHHQLKVLELGNYGATRVSQRHEAPIWDQNITVELLFFHPFFLSFATTCLFVALFLRHSQLYWEAFPTHFARWISKPGDQSVCGPVWLCYPGF